MARQPSPVQGIQRPIATVPASARRPWPPAHGGPRSRGSARDPDIEDSPNPACGGLREESNRPFVKAVADGPSHNMLGRRRDGVSTWLPPPVSPTSRMAPCRLDKGGAAPAPVVEKGGPRPPRACG